MYNTNPSRHTHIRIKTNLNTNPRRSTNLRLLRITTTLSLIMTSR
jgi:hypothetical protein